MTTESGIMTQALCDVFREVRSGRMSMKTGSALAAIADATARIAIGESNHKRGRKGNGRVDFFDKSVKGTPNTNNENVVMNVENVTIKHTRK